MEEELKSPETSRKLLKIRKGTRETLESDVKNNPKRKRQLLRKAVGEPKNSPYGQFQQWNLKQEKTLVLQNKSPRKPKTVKNTKLNFFRRKEKGGPNPGGGKPRPGQKSLPNKSSQKKEGKNCLQEKTTRAEEKTPARKRKRKTQSRTLEKQLGAQ